MKDTAIYFLFLDIHRCIGPGDQHRIISYVITPSNSFSFFAPAGSLHPDTTARPTNNNAVNQIFVLLICFIHIIYLQHIIIV